MALLKSFVILATLLFLHACVAAPSLVKSIAGSFTNTAYADGTSSVARFHSVRGMTLDQTNGDLYVGDYINRALRKVDVQGTASTLLKTTTGPYIYGVAIDLANSRIFFGSADGKLSYYNKTSSQVVVLYQTTVSNSEIATVKYDPITETLYWVEYISALRSWKSPFTDTSTINTIWSAIPNSHSWSFLVDGPSTYVTQDSQVTLVNGSVGSAFVGSANNAGYVNAVGTNARFNIAEGIAWNEHKTGIYVADQLNSVIRFVEIATRNVSTAAGIQGTSSFVPSPNAQFYYCSEIYAHPLLSNFYYIGDEAGVRVWYGSAPLLDGLTAEYNQNASTIVVAWKTLVPFVAVTSNRIVIRSPGETAIVELTPRSSYTFYANPQSNYNITVTAINEFGDSKSRTVERST